MLRPMSSMPEPLHPVARGLAAPAGSLASYPPVERWDDWETYDAAAWPKKVKRRFALIPTICFNCEAACGLLAYVDKSTGRIEKFEGNPVHPGSRGRNCAKGPATLNQVNDPERIRYPLRRKGARGGGEWERVTWDEALDDIAGRIRRALVDGRPQEVMYHLGRPGHELIYLQRVFHAWGIDGHNSHTNVCSAGARAGYAFWMGFDRPSPDHANARFMLLLSSHLESGHYFNPHAQRIIEGKMQGAKICVIDTRLSNTASMADWWLSPWPGSEAALLLAIARLLVLERRYDRDFVRRWVNWEEYLREERPDLPGTYEGFERALEELYASYTPEFAERESGIPAATIVEIAGEIARSGSALATHVWRNTAAGNLGGWQVARALQFLVVLMGAVATPGGTAPGAFNKAVPAPPMMPAPGRVWSELLMPREYPLAFFEMSFLLPHFLKEGRGKLAMYFTRVYNPVWTNPDGLSWVEMLTDEAKVERHACLTPIWSETAWFADYVLPMGHASERHDLMSQETHAARWIGFRQPVLREVLRRQGREFEWTWQAHEAAGIGQVWEEDELWIELSWRIDPDGSLGIRKYFESPYRPGEKLRIEELYRWIFEHSVPGLPEAAQKEGLTPLAVHAQVRLLPHRGRRVRDARQAGRGEGSRGRLRRPRHQAGEAGRARGRRRDRRRRARGLSHALAQARVLLEDAQGLEVARAGRAGVCAEPGALVESRPRQGRDGALADLPAAHAHPHAVRQCQVADGAVAHQSDLGAPARCAPARRRDRRSAQGRDGHRRLRGPRVGDRGPAPRHHRVLPSHRPLAARGDERRRAVVDRPRRSEERGAGAVADAPDPRRPRLSRARTPTRAASGGRRPASTRTSRSPSSPTPSPASTAGTRRSA